MFVIVSASVASAGLPLEGIVFIAGDYRVMGGGSTSLNVLGNALALAVIVRWQENQATSSPGRLDCSLWF